jgi:hypothetical protein
LLQAFLVADYPSIEGNPHQKNPKNSIGDVTWSERSEETPGCVYESLAVGLVLVMLQFFSQIEAE